MRKELEKKPSSEQKKLFRAVLKPVVDKDGETVLNGGSVIYKSDLPPKAGRDAWVVTHTETPFDLRTGDRWLKKKKKWICYLSPKEVEEFTCDDKKKVTEHSDTIVKIFIRGFSVREELKKMEALQSVGVSDEILRLRFTI